MQPVRTYYSTGERLLVAPSRRALVVPIGLRGDGRGGHRRGDRGRRRGRDGRVRDGRHGRVHRRPRLHDPLGGGPPEGRAAVRPAGGADRAAARVRRGRRRTRPGARRAGRDHRLARAHRPARTGVRSLGLRGQHDLGDGPRARDRLLAVRRLPLSRGTAPRKREAPRHRDGGLDGEPRRAVQRLGVRPRDGRDGARPGHDPPQPRRRSDPRRDRHGARGAHAAAGRARPDRRPRQRPPGALAGTEGRAERGRRGTGLVAHRPQRHAHAGPGGRALGRPARGRRPAGAADGDGPHRRPRAARTVRGEAGLHAARGGVRGRHRRLGAGRRRGRHRGGPGRAGDRGARAPRRRRRCVPARRGVDKPGRQACERRGARRRRQPRRARARGGAAPALGGRARRSSPGWTPRSSSAGRPPRWSTTAS